MTDTITTPADPDNNVREDFCTEAQNWHSKLIILAPLPCEVGPIELTGCLQQPNTKRYKSTPTDKITKSLFLYIIIKPWVYTWRTQKENIINVRQPTELPSPYLCIGFYKTSFPLLQTANRNWPGWSDAAQESNVHVLPVPLTILIVFIRIS